MRKKRFIISLSILSILLICIASLCLSIGTYSISIPDILKTLGGNGSKMQNTAIFSIRMPRILVGMFVGIALSTAGCILQTVTKNDLADSGIIGINAGAAVAAILFISYQTKSYYSELGEFSIYVLPILAIIGAFVAAFFIYILSSKNGIKPKRLLLIGIGVNTGLNAFITFFTFRGGVGDYNRVLIWTSGSLWGSGWSYAKVIIPIVTIVFLLVLYHHKTLDVLHLTDETATGIGVYVEGQRRKLLLFAVILAGTATAFAGNIGFIGLIAPHIARKLVGPFHRYFIIISAFISVNIILIADLVAKNLFSPIEIPVGIVVSIFGVPYFIYLMLKEN
ncbi:FecCD family ABC transporter permease [Clostridium sp. Marseille-P299]|uniref:FecCD family ABC transporter permease n=1 Tax=Clostridium sp. Marseille-P299 TaxID=1805477 RepID=UPI0008313DBF|nr:iron ABC transporter permease [Clostridium sp. Marseille-P299]